MFDMEGHGHQIPIERAIGSEYPHLGMKLDPGHELSAVSNVAASEDSYIKCIIYSRSFIVDHLSVNHIYPRTMIELSSSSFRIKYTRSSPPT